MTLRLVAGSQREERNGRLSEEAAARAEGLLHVVAVVVVVVVVWQVGASLRDGRARVPGGDREGVM